MGVQFAVESGQLAVAWFDSVGKLFNKPPGAEQWTGFPSCFGFIVNRQQPKVSGTNGPRPGNTCRGVWLVGKGVLYWSLGGEEASACAQSLPSAIV